MGFELDVTIPIITVLLQGILSFFSPCILPIIPLYVSYLSGGSSSDESNRKNHQLVIFKNTICFIIGISFAFFLLGIGFSALGQFLLNNQILFTRIGGILIVLLGLVQLGILNKPFGGREWKLPVSVSNLPMNPITALLMGFTFSFAWTPCVGPALSTVLIMVSSTSNTVTGVILMIVYTVGFTIPFLMVGLFTNKCLDIFRKYGNIVAYTVKIGGVLMILIGIMMLTGTINGISGYFSSWGNSQGNPLLAEESNEESILEEDDMTEDPPTESEDIEEELEKTEEVVDNDVVPAIAFSLEDQYGKIHTISDYKGKVIFLNFWATWCPPCVQEMPDIQQIYELYGYNETDVIILGVATPNDENSYTQEGSKQHVIDFLLEHEYTYPTLMDTTGMLAMQYGISAYPTTFMIDMNGNVYGYIPGMLTYEIMESIIEQTISSLEVAQ